MSASSIIGLVLVTAAIAYMVYVLIKPEDFS
ncbi:MAG: potassium-transporting ATPase subunit F [Actinomycetaceae bacterium]|nr:potassium-transporting ATPase subunit F [Actinomycetaceae bacterium]MDU0970378.1 potassium-transporting ATPase subunit F [Actinomycetaceae bacterium]